jgi:hypothetical protein
MSWASQREMCSRQSETFLGQIVRCVPMLRVAGREACAHETHNIERKPFRRVVREASNGKGALAVAGTGILLALADVGPVRVSSLP